MEALILRTISGVSEYDMCRLISVSHEWGLDTDKLIEIYNIIESEISRMRHKKRK